MRVFVSFQGSSEPFDISPVETVGTIKQMAEDRFHVRLSDGEQVRHVLELSFAGAVLLDTWVLSDVGISPGSTVRCTMKNEQKPVLCVFNAVMRETFPVLGSAFLLSSSVARLKSLVSHQCGLPVSTFKLTTPPGVQLYDCNQLHDYKIEAGTTLWLDTWDGWAEFLRGCFLGHRLTVQSHLSQEKPLMRFQLRVALYIAAFQGHVDLAGWLLEKGIHAETPVGVHPFRQWCRQTAHPDAAKCPVHVAAERGQLLVLKLFVSNNLLTLARRDPEGCDPLRIAVRHGHAECARYLGDKLSSTVSLPKISLPMRLYIQVKRWARAGQRRAAFKRRQDTRERARVEDTVLVDGFNHTKMSSKPRRKGTKACRWVRGRSLQPLTSVRLHRPSTLPSQGTSLPLCELRSSVRTANADESLKEQKRGGKSGEGCLLDKDDNNSQWRSRAPLPPISRDTNPRPLSVYASPGSSHILTTSLESCSRYCGRTPRENAIYCLAMASTFTERSWLQQLDVARSLIRRSVHSMT